MKTIIFTILTCIASLSGNSSNKGENYSGYISDGQQENSGNQNSDLIGEKSSEAQSCFNTLKTSNNKQALLFKNRNNKKHSTKKIKLPDGSFLDAIFGDSLGILKIVLFVFAGFTLSIGLIYFGMILYSIFSFYLFIGLSIIGLGALTYFLVERASKTNGGKGEKFIAAMEKAGGVPLQVISLY